MTEGREGKDDREKVDQEEGEAKKIRDGKKKRGGGRDDG